MHLGESICGSQSTKSQLPEPHRCRESHEVCTAYTIGEQSRFRSQHKTRIMVSLFFNGFVANIYPVLAPILRRF